MTQEPSPVRSSLVTTPLSSTVAVHRPQDQRHRQQEFANKRKQAPKPAVEIDEEAEPATPAAPSDDDNADKHEVDFLA